jgi:hypothetical protein
MSENSVIISEKKYLEQFFPGDSLWWRKNIISVMSSMAATMHIWLMSACNVASATEEPNF